MACWKALGVGARIAAAGIVATAVATGGVARADDDPEEDESAEAAPPGEVPSAPVAAPAPEEDIEAEVDEAPAEAQAAQAAPPEQDPSSVLIPSKHAAKFGRRPLSPLPAPESYRPAMQRRSPGLMATGIVFTSLGAITAVVGGALLASAHREEQEHRVIWAEPTVSGSRQMSYSGFDRDPGAEQMRKAGMASLLVGLTAVGLGIPFIAIGARRVPTRSVECAVGPSGGSVTVHF